MFKKSAIAAIATLSLTAGVANAEGAYFGANFASLDYSEDMISEEASLTAAYARLGTNFNENFSGELRVGLGIGDDSVGVYGTDENVELDSMYGAYVRGGVPVSESFFPYVVLGYTRGEVTASVPGFSGASSSETDTSFGIGADLNVTPGVTLNAEYMSYFDKDGAEISGLSIGISSHF